MSEWPTMFQPHVEAILAARPELRDRFRVVSEDGYAEFVELPTKYLPDGTFDSAWYTEQDRLWDKGTTYGDDEVGERVLHGHTWRVTTDPNLSDAKVWCDGVETSEGPDFEYQFYQAFELVELGLWPMPDFQAIWKAELATAERALLHHDEEVFRAPQRRARLVEKLEVAKAKLLPPPPTPTVLEARAAKALELVERLRPRLKQVRKEDIAVQLMGMPESEWEHVARTKFS